MAQPKIKNSAVGLTTINAITLNGAIAGTGINNLVQLDGTAKLPAVDGSALTGVSVPYSGALVYTTLSTSVPDSTYTIIPFEQKIFDTDTIHDAGINVYRLVVPTGVTKIKLHAYVNWQNNAIGERRMTIIKNGIAGGVNGQLGIPSSDIAAKTNANKQYIESNVIIVTDIDYFEVEVYQTSGGALLVTNSSATDAPYFAMEIIEKEI